MAEILGVAAACICYRLAVWRIHTTPGAPGSRERLMDTILTMALFAAATALGTAALIRGIPKWLDGLHADGKVRRPGNDDHVHSTASRTNGGNDRGDSEDALADMPDVDGVRQRQMRTVAAPQGQPLEVHQVAGARLHVGQVGRQRQHRGVVKRAAPEARARWSAPTSAT